VSTINSNLKIAQRTGIVQGFESKKIVLVTVSDRVAQPVDELIPHIEDGGCLISGGHLLLVVIPRVLGIELNLGLGSEESERATKKMLMENSIIETLDCVERTNHEGLEPNHRVEGVYS
jgi:hypothetical protein